MGLRQKVLDFASAAKRFPELGSNPKELAKLARSASNSYDGMFAAQSAPIAKYTWEVAASLDGSDAESDRQPFTIPKPSKIIGMQAWVEPTSSGAIVPTLSSILVSIDINQDTRITSAQGQITTSGLDGTFVTLGSICTAQTAGLRLFGWKVKKRDDLGFTFKWKRGVGVYDDVIVSVTLFCTNVDEDEEDES